MREYTYRVKLDTGDAIIWDRVVVIANCASIARNKVKLLAAIFGYRVLSANWTSVRDIVTK